MKISDSQSNKLNLDKLFWPLIVLVAALQFIVFVAYHHDGWHADMFISFAPYVLIGSFLLYCGLIIFERKNYKNIGKNISFIAIFILFYFNFQPINGWLYQTDSSVTLGVDSAESIKLASFNKLVTNNDIESVKAAIGKYDIVAVSEITKDNFQALSPSWKYSAVSDCKCDPAFGVEIAVFSKYKITATETVPATGDYGVAMRAVVELSNQQDMIVHAIHPQAPVSHQAFMRRNNMLMEIVAPRVVADKNRPAVLVGDMNLSPYSQTYQAFANKIKPYKNSGKGANVWRTWCLAEVPLMCSPIDHIFVSSKINSSPAKTVKVSGSDHMLVTADLVIK